MADINVVSTTLGITGLIALKGDASTRQYWRCDQGIVMIDDLDGGDLRRTKFVDIAQRLRNAKLNAPKIFAHDQKLGVVLLEDFGAGDLSQNPTTANYKRALDLIFDLNSVDAQNLTQYSDVIYREELSRVNRYYLSPLGIDDHELVRISELFVTELAAHSSTFVHVDFHAENLMLCDDGSFGILDFQDARFGHPLYDLASLVDDVRVEVPNASELLAFGLQQANFNHGELWFHVISVQRLIKIVGIFARLTAEGRNGYDRLLPRCFAILEKRLNHPELKELKVWFEDVIPKPTAATLAKLRA